MRKHLDCLLRKESGGGSVLCLLYLCLVILMGSGIYTSMQRYKEIYSLTHEYLKGHYVYLEALYYARVEIYDETYWDLEEVGEDYSVSVDFDILRSSVEIKTSYKGITREERFQYDRECHCLYIEE
ncbi:MAG: hypothetical protein E7191_05970 [Erysipelotrichaceae bacterium]|nr:hypothetical protein [Erysipelotrichaceae bacterium]